MTIKISKALSFDFWNLWEFIKGRKKTAITVVAMLGTHFALDSGLITLLSGPVFEGLWAIAEFYLKPVKIE